MVELTYCELRDRAIRELACVLSRVLSSRGEVGRFGCGSRRSVEDCVRLVELCRELISVLERCGRIRFVVENGRVKEIVYSVEVCKS